MEKPPCLSGSFKIVEASTASLSLALNLTLIWLICYRTPKELRTYSRVLLCNCVVDSMFSACSYLLEIHVDIRQGMFVMVGNGPFVADLHTNLVLVCVYLFVVYFTIAVVAVPMIYRYFGVCRNIVLSSPQLALLVLSAAALSSSVGLTAYWILVPASVRTTLEQRALIDAYPCHDKGEMYTFLLRDVISAIAIPFLTGECVITAIYIIVVFCVIRIKRTAQEAARGVRIQVHYALLFQATTPLIVIVIPVSGMIVAVFTKSEFLRIMVQYCSSSVAWIPVLNPLSTIMFIKCYRNSLTKFFVKVAPTSTTGTSRPLAGPGSSKLTTSRCSRS